MKKLFYNYGAFGLIVRFFKCWKENGALYTVKQLFKSINKEKQALIPFVSIQSQSLHIEKIKPRPSGLIDYPLTSLENIIELRSKSQDLKGIYIQTHVIDWEVPLFQRPQHMAISMAKAGYLVFYITTNGYDNVNGFTEVYRNVFVTNDFNLCSKMKNAVISIYSTASHFTSDKLKSIKKNNILIYEYIDHIDPKINGGDTVKKLTEQFARINDETVDFVICSSKKLITDFEKKINPSKISYIPNGVEFEHFESALAASEHTPIPPELYNIIKSNRPVVGYYGAIAPWLWYDMLKEAIELLSDFDFIFIGPDYNGGVENLPKLSNCYHLGSVDYKILPMYATHFQVAIIPFEPGPIAQTTSPLKLFEYFALQKPVVVVKDMQECVAFKEVFSATNAQEFAEEIRKAYFIGKNVKFKKRLREIALENTWDKRAQTLDKLMINYTKPVKEIF